MATFNFVDPRGNDEAIEAIRNSAHISEEPAGATQDCASPSPNKTTTTGAFTSFLVSAASIECTSLPGHTPVDLLSSPDAEFELCGWLLRMTDQDLNQAERIFDRMSEKDVSYPVYRNIVASAKYLINHQTLVSATTVLDYANVNGLDVGGAELLAQLINDPIGRLAGAEHLDQDVTLILDYAARRRIRSQLQAQIEDLRARPLADTVNALSDLVSSLQNDADIIRTEPQHISEPVEQVLESIFDETPVNAPISTGIEELDAKLNGGIRDQDMVVIAGRPGMGKTAMSVNGLGRNMAVDTRHHRPVLVFSLEMSAHALATRILASESGVPLRFFRAGQANSAAFHEPLSATMPLFAPVGEDLSESKSMRMWIDDTPGLRLPDIRARSRQFARKYGRPIIIIDYMQLLAVDATDHRGVGTVSTGLKRLAKELNTPVIALAQLNRSLESRTNKQPIMSDLRESGNIEQDADIIMFLYRDVVYNPDTPDPDEALVIIAKQREGECGPVSMRFNGPLVRYESRYAPAEAMSDAMPSSQRAPQAAASQSAAQHGGGANDDQDSAEDDYYDPTML